MNEWFHGLDTRDVRYAALTLLEDALYGEAYNRNEDGQEISDTEAAALATADNADDLELFTVAAYFLGRIEEAWETPVWFVLKKMGLETGEHGQALALAKLFMNVIGHGIGLNDDWSEELENARKATGKPLPACPVHLYDNPFHDCAWELMNRQFGEVEEGVAA